MIFHKMCEAVKPVMEKIFHHPFNLALAQGVLSREKFMHYLIQDALYLTDFAKSLAMTASRLSNAAHSQQFMQFSFDAIQVERSLHLNYLEKNQFREISTEKNSACSIYTNYLLGMAGQASAEEAVASLLPCFWVYRELGKNMISVKSSDHPYHEWIAQYTDKSFETSVNAAIAIGNHLGEMISNDIRNKMLAAFVHSTQLELLFWDDAWGR